MARVLLIEGVEVYRRGLLDILCRHCVVDCGRTAPAGAFDVTVLSTSSLTPPSLLGIAIQMDTPFVTVSEEGEWRGLMSVAGVSGLRAVVHRHSSADTIRAAIDRVLEGHTYVDPAVAAIARVARAAWLVEVSVTDREMSVLQGIQRGHTNTEIARRLGCTVRTVKFHVSNLLRKCGVTSRFELVQRLTEFDIEAAMPAAD